MVLPFRGIIEIGGYTPPVFRLRRLFRAASIFAGVALPFTFEAATLTAVAHAYETSAGCCTSRPESILWMAAVAAGASFAGVYVATTISPLTSDPSALTTGGVTP